MTAGGELEWRGWVHSFILAISIAPLQVLYYSEALPTTARIQSAQTTVAQGSYVAARAGVEPTTLRLKAIDSTKAPPCLTWSWGTIYDRVIIIIIIITIIIIKIIIIAFLYLFVRRIQRVAEVLL